MQKHKIKKPKLYYGVISLDSNIGSLVAKTSTADIAYYTAKGLNESGMWYEEFIAIELESRKRIV